MDETKNIDEAREFVQSHIDWYTPMAKRCDGKLFKGKMMTYAGCMRKYLNGVAKQFKDCDMNVYAAAKEAAKTFK